MLSAQRGHVNQFGIAGTDVLVVAPADVLLDQLHEQRRVAVREGALKEEEAIATRLRLVDDLGVGSSFPGRGPVSRTAPRGSHIPPA
jgi:hypothetical protein